MKNLCIALTASLFAISVSAWGQTPIPRDPGSSPKTPKESGMPDSSGSSMQAPRNSGVVIVPPKTGSEEMVTKPRNVDPEMNSTTEEIDRKTRKKSEEKAQ